MEKMEIIKPMTIIMIQNTVFVNQMNQNTLFLRHSCQYMQMFSQSTKYDRFLWQLKSFSNSPSQLLPFVQRLLLSAPSQAFVPARSLSRYLNISHYEGDTCTQIIFNNFFYHACGLLFFDKSLSDLILPE